MWKISTPIKTAFFTVFFLFVFTYLFARLFGPIPFSVNSVTTNKNDLFTVSGEGEATAVPDTALVHVGVTKNGSTVEQAKDDVNTAVNKMIEDLKKLGIEDKNIKTVNFSVNPNYDYSRGTNAVTGYTVSQDLQVKVDPIDKANKVVDQAIADGANVAGGITFTLNDDKKMALEQKAREDAIKKAKDKADAIAKASGIRLGRLVNVQEGQNAATPLPMMSADLRASGKGAAEETNIQPGENSVNVTVTLSYETF